MIPTTSDWNIMSLQKWLISTIPRRSHKYFIVQPELHVYTDIKLPFYTMVEYFDN